MFHPFVFKWSNSRLRTTDTNKVSTNLANLMRQTQKRRKEKQDESKMDHLCHRVGASDVCEKRKVGGSSYTYVLGQTEVMQASLQTTQKVTQPVQAKSSPSRPIVEARKSAAGTRLALIRRLIQSQSKGVPYSAINAYLRKELNDAGMSDNMSTSFIVDMLTYDPRNDTPKDYPGVLTALSNSSGNYDWLPFWDIVDGLAWD